jgi:hypothetical protein
VQSILGSDLIGMYLDGSLATGDFDEASDIDFVAITAGEISEQVFAALAAMHERINGLEQRMAAELEGSYVSQQTARRYAAGARRYAAGALLMYPNIERGRGERLKLVEHGVTWNIHRYLLREKGIVLVGPNPKTLIDPVTREDLRLAMHEILKVWAVNLLQHPDQIQHRGYQSYIVLSLCRILYTLAEAAVTSKAAALRWALDTLSNEWHPLIEDAWVGRSQGWGAPDADMLRRTLDFIRYTLAVEKALGAK